MVSAIHSPAVLALIPSRSAIDVSADPFHLEQFDGMTRAITRLYELTLVEAALRGGVESLGVKPNEVFQPIRVAISGKTVSPGIFESVAALGREETLARIDAALDRVTA